MVDDGKRITVVFFKSDSGTEPVREWLKDLDREDKKIVGTDIKTVEFGWPIGMPTCRSIGDGVWEVRSNLTRGRIARVLFCITDGFMVLLHGFIKKSQKTPKPDLDIARRRKRQLTEESS
jgi:phage-related protein